MKMNDIKFAPKSNAFADVYGKATGMPFVGEIVAAAAGNGGESPEPEQFQLTVKVIKINDYPTYDMEVHSNIPAPVENASIYIYDDPTLGGCEGDYSPAFSGHFIPLSSDHTEWISEDYYCDGGEIEDGCGYTFVAQAEWLENDISGTWTYEDQTPPQFAFTSVKVIKIGEDDYTVEATSNIQAPVDNPYVYMDDDPTLGGCEGDYTMAFNVQIIPTVEDPTKWVLNEHSDYHSFVASEIEDGCGYVYRATAPWIDNTVETDDDTYQNTITGTWTFEDQTI